MTWSSWLDQVIEGSGGNPVENFARNTSAILAILVVIGIFVLLALSQVVPSELWSAFGLVVGFFFGHQSGQGTARTSKN